MVLGGGGGEESVLSDKKGSKVLSSGGREGSVKENPSKQHVT